MQDLECVLQPGAEGFVSQFENGVRVAIEAMQFTMRGITSIRNLYGVEYEHLLAQPPTIPDDKWQNFVVTPVSGWARSGGALLHPEFGTGVNAVRDTIIDETGLTIDASYPILDFSAYEIEVPDTQAAFSSPAMGATVTDSLGTRELPAGRDQCLLEQGQIWGCLRANGFWQETGTGRYFFEMPEIIRDGATGVMKKYMRRIYLAPGSFSNDPRGAPSPWITGPWVDNGAKA